MYESYVHKLFCLPNFFFLLDFVIRPHKKDVQIHRFVLRDCSCGDFLGSPSVCVATESLVVSLSEPYMIWLILNGNIQWANGEHPMDVRGAFLRGTHVLTCSFSCFL